MKLAQLYREVMLELDPGFKEEDFKLCDTMVPEAMIREVPAGIDLAKLKAELRQQALELMALTPEQRSALLKTHTGKN